MLTGGDDYPVHQTPEPVALVTDRNFYDRYFFNGYSPDARLFFAAAMGFYPALDVVDAAFCVSIDGVQHNLRASARLSGERMRLTVGPITIIVEQPLHRLRLSVAPNTSPLSGELCFTGRHAPIEEPRFTRRNGARLFMDYTRMTQNGRWSGGISVGGHHVELGAEVVGTRDRSWGIRPVGKPDAQPAPMPGGPQFFWLWTPCNFADRSLFFHSNDDAAGAPWNRRTVIVGDDSAARHWDAPTFALDWIPGGRRVAAARIDLAADTQLTLTPSGSRFYMNGLGYTHPVWGHGMDHGELEVAFDQIDLATVADGDFANMHVQALADAVLLIDGAEHHGRGVVEQMLIGPHAPSGLTGLFDPVS